MELPASVEWSVHCAVLLAQLPDGGPTSALSGRRLAEYFDLPPAYLSKVLKVLVSGGVLHAGKGPQGGYRLARPAADITVLEIVQAVDGTRPAFRCAEIRQRGPVGLDPSQCRKACGVASVMHRAEQSWRTELAAVTVADLVTDAGPPSRRRADGWLKTLAG